MDLVSTWKASSIVLTGAFGILGLLTEFKRKVHDGQGGEQNKVTGWGYVSLIGIVLSTCLGFEAQIKESADDSAKALKYAQTNQTTLEHLKRILSPLEEPNLEISFGVPCSTEAYKHVCTAASSLSNSNDHVRSLQLWHLFPGTSLQTELMVTFFTDPEVADGYFACPPFTPNCSRAYPEPDLTFYLHLASSGSNRDATLEQGVLEPVVVTCRQKVLHSAFGFNNGNIASIRDLDGATAIIQSTDPIGFARLHLHPIHLKMTFPNGQVVTDNETSGMQETDEMLFKFKLVHVKALLPKPMLRSN